MTRPLSPARARRVAWWGRLAGLLTLVLAGSLAAATAPPPAPPVPTLPALSDSTAEAIASVEVVKSEDGPSEIVVQLKDGYGRETAEAVADDTGLEPGNDRLVVRYAGGAVERRVRLRSGGAGGPDAPPPPPAASDLDPDLIESIDVQNLPGGLRALEVRLHDGATESDAEALADQMLRRGGVARVRVRLADGRAVERTAPTTGARPLAPADTTDEVYEIADVQPELIGGLAGIQENVQYPESARADDVEGTVIVQFIVDKQGGVTDAVVLRSPDDRLSEAALAAVRQARFRPGRQRGEPVRVRFAVPITFRLSGEADRPAPGLRSERPESRPDDEGVYNVAEVQPELIGGLQALQEAVVYPESARNEGVEGQVVVQFVVTEEGGVADPTVLRSPDDRLGQAALDAVRGLRFRPGTVRGEPVRVRFAVPVTFRLPGSTAPSESDARAARFPNARLTASGVDPSLFGNAALFNRMLTSSGRIVRESQPALPDGSQATIRFSLDDRGVVTGGIETASVNQVLGDVSRGLVGLLTARPQPDLAGRSFEFTTTYVRGD